MGEGGIRIRAVIAGVARYASVSQGKEEHERTCPGGVLLSVSVSPSVNGDEKLLNPMIQMVQKHGMAFASRTGFVRETAHTLNSLLLIESDTNKNDLMTQPGRSEQPSKECAASILSSPAYRSARNGISPFSMDEWYRFGGTGQRGFTVGLEMRDVNLS